MALFYPTRYLYVSDEAKKNRHIKGRGIAVANHVAFLDAQMMPRLYPQRRLRMVVGDIVYRNNGKLMHFWLKQAHVVHVGDAQSDPSLSLQGFAEALELLKANALLGIFPEGEIHWNGELGSFHAGVVGLALLSGAKIYPSYTLRPYRLFHRQVILIGEAIDYRGKGDFNKETLLVLAHDLETSMLTLKAQGEAILAQEKAKK
jgi:1-acyl-sn-glycerol-3-phosphate acyltransferase